VAGAHTSAVRLPCYATLHCSRPTYQPSLPRPTEPRAKCRCRATTTPTGLSEAGHVPNTPTSRAMWRSQARPPSPLLPAAPSFESSRPSPPVPHFPCAPFLLAKGVQHFLSPHPHPLCVSSVTSNRSALPHWNHEETTSSPPPHGELPRRVVLARINHHLTPLLILHASGASPGHRRPQRALPAAEPDVKPSPR
jgi:hypothetical protein